MGERCLGAVLVNSMRKRNASLQGGFPSSHCRSMVQKSGPASQDLLQSPSRRRARGTRHPCRSPSLHQRVHSSMCGRLWQAESKAGKSTHKHFPASAVSSSKPLSEEGLEFLQRLLEAVPCFPLTVCIGKALEVNCEIRTKWLQRKVAIPSEWYGMWASPNRPLKLFLARHLFEGAVELHLGDLRACRKVCAWLHMSETVRLFVLCCMPQHRKSLPRDKP